jgi:hypothetical protein
MRVPHRASTHATMGLFVLRFVQQLWRSCARHARTCTAWGCVSKSTAILYIKHFRSDDRAGKGHARAVVSD